MARWIHIWSASIIKTYRTEKPDSKRRQRILWARNRTKVQHIEQNWSCGLLHLEVGRGGWEFPSVGEGTWRSSNTDRRETGTAHWSLPVHESSSASKQRHIAPAVHLGYGFENDKVEIHQPKPIPLLLNWVWDIPRSLQARAPPADGRSGWRV